MSPLHSFEMSRLTPAATMNKLKIVFMGTAELSCASFEALALDREFSIAGVVTQPDKPKGRELKLQPSPIKTIAQKLNLLVLQPTRARDETFLTELRELNPDLIIVVAYGQILPQTILDLPRYGCLNVHTSLLPKYRGAAPIQWAIANGESETGVTIMKMDAGLDTGPILSQRRTSISQEDDSKTLHDRLARIGAELLIETIPDFVAGKIQPKPQPAEGVSLAPKIKKEDGHINWNLTAQAITNRLRAFTTWPGAFTFLSRTGFQPASDSDRQDAYPTKQLLKIWKAEPVEVNGEVGTILSADKNGIVVGCGSSALRIVELQLEGKRRMNVTEFLAGHSLKPGEKFAA